MKKILIPVLALTWLASSCDILEKDPLPSIAPETFFKTADDAESGLTGAYDALQKTGLYSQDLIVVGEMPSDNCTSENGDVTALDRFTWSSTTSQVFNIYRDAYQGINRANAVLKYVPAIEMSNAERKNQILGEARFLRALHYFTLVQLYGGVPLRLEPTESGAPDVVSLPRATADQVYEQIIGDLTAAEPLAATSFGNLTGDRARATKAAVNGLLARVYLVRRQWGAAQAAAAKVISNNSYSLARPFKSLFPANNVAESILEVQNSGTADGNNILPDLLLPAPPATYSFPKFNIPTVELIRYADTVANATDQRWVFLGTTNAGRDHGSYVDGGRGTSNDDGPFVYKWPGNPNSFNSPDNTYILRLADVLLMYAEAANEAGGPSADALDKLNQVRTRANLPALTLAQLNSKQLFRDEVDRQRRLELAFEGIRWFDLLRYAHHNAVEPNAHRKTALDLIAEKRQGNRDVNYLLLPIPQYELTNNRQAQQNPGY